MSIRKLLTEAELSIAIGESLENVFKTFSGLGYTRAEVHTKLLATLDTCDKAIVPFRELPADSAETYLARRNAEARQAAGSPQGLALQKAFAARRANDQVAYKAACLEWLHHKTGCAMGDTLEVHGWAKPRHIKVENFYIDFEPFDKAVPSFLWFEGAWVNGGPRNKDKHKHGAPAESGIYRCRN